MIANLLETRKQEVVIVTRDDKQPIKLSQMDRSSGTEIEQYIVTELKRRHEVFKTNC